MDPDEQPLNKPDKLIILFVFHFEMSGNDSSNKHSENKPDISLIFLIS